VWIRLELINWILIFLLYSLLLFILWQSVSSLILLFGWIILKINWLILISLLLKSGMPPLIWWVIQVDWKWTGWIIFLTFHKCVPFIIFLLVCKSQFIFLVWPLVGLVFLYSRREWFNLMWGSSIRDSRWICISLSWKRFWFFFYLLCCLSEVKKIKNFLYFKT